MTESDLAAARTRDRLGRARVNLGQRLSAGLAIVVLLAGCAGSSSEPTVVAPTATTTGAAATPLVTIVPVSTPASTAAVPDLAGKFDVGGHELYLECYGTTGPVMVFDAGSGGTSDLWKLSPEGFIGRVDNSYRRCLYDRTNLGRSDHVSGPRTSATAADELHALLIEAGLDGPYVLVGRSFGGYNVRLFAAKYPKDVAALILIETLTPEFHDGFKALVTQMQWLSEVAGVNATEPPLDVIASGKLVAAAKLPNVPLLVVAGTKWHSGNVPWAEDLPGTELDALWDRAQLDLGASVPGGKTVVFEGGDHALQVSQPARLAAEMNAFLAGL